MPPTPRIDSRLAVRRRRGVPPSRLDGWGDGNETVVYSDMLIGRVSLFTATLGILVAACSSGSGSGGTGQGSGDCGSLCDRVTAVGCPNEPANECMSMCQSSFGQYESECPSQTASYIGCIQSLPLECSSSGRVVIVGGNDAILAACESSALAMASCTACLPDVDDDACDTCRKQSCCPEWKAYLGDPAVLDFSNCISACTETTCADACFAQYPSLKAKFDTVLACEQANCSSC